VYVQLAWFKIFGLNRPVCSICQYFISGSKLLDGIALYVQVVNTSCLVQNFWMESPCMFKLSVLHVWFKTFGWKHPVCSACLLDIWFKNFGLNHPVCLICQYFMSGSKHLDGITMYIELVCSSCLVQSLDGITMYVLHVWFKTFRLNHTVCSTCQYFMSGSKLLDGISLYVQLVSTSCLLQNFWIEPPCMFNLSVFHVWFKTFGWNHPVCLICRYFMSGSQLWIESPCMFKLSVLHVWLKTFGWNHPVCLICQYFMSGSKLLDGFTLYVQLVSTSCLVQNIWMESPCMFNLSVLHVWFKTFG
jgi:hypothetical protein